MPKTHGVSGKEVVYPKALTRESSRVRHKLLMVLLEVPMTLFVLLAEPLLEPLASVAMDILPNADLLPPRVLMLLSSPPEVPLTLVVLLAEPLVEPLASVATDMLPNAD